MTRTSSPPAPARPAAPSGAASRGGNGDLAFALLVACAFAAAAGWGAFHHEMWRDEAQAWLVARDSASPLDVLRNARYDGHPGTWFLLLWPLAHLGLGLGAMQAVHVLAGAATAFLVARFAPGPRWVRALAILGYLPLYEYGVIARNYGIGVLALVAFIAVFPRRDERPLSAGLLLALAANTSLPATILAIAAAGAWGFDAVARRAAPGRGRTWAGIGAAGAGVVLAVLQMRPPPDTGYMTDWRLGLDASALGESLRTVVAAFLPLPRLGPDSWGSSYLEGTPGFGWWSVVLALALLAIAVLGLLRRPVALAFFALSALGLLSFFYVKSPGYIRHQGFLFVALALALWMAAASGEGDPGWETPAGGWGARAARLAFPSLLAIHVAAAAIALANEQRLVFAGGRDAARLIRSRGLERLPLVVHRDWMGMAVLAYLGADRAYYPAGSRWGSYVVWDTARTVEENVWAGALRCALRTESAVVVVADAEIVKRDPPPRALEPALTPVGCRPGEIVSGESFCVWFLDRGRIPPALERTAR